MQNLNVVDSGSQQNQEVTHTNKKLEFVSQNSKEITTKPEGWLGGFYPGHPTYNGQGKHGPYLRTKLAKFLNQPVSAKQFNKIKSRILEQDISTQEDAMLGGILYIANYSKNEKAKLMAAEFISDRFYGKPIQPVISKNLNIEGDLDDIDDGTLSDRLERINKQLAETETRIANTETKYPETPRETDLRD